MLPVHPHCLCWLSPVFKEEIKDKTAHNQVEGGGRGYLFSQSLHHRQQILGIHGNKAVSNQDSWTKWARNYSGKVLQAREIKTLPESLQPYLQDGKIKIAEIAKRRQNESEKDFEKRICDYIASDYCTKEFTSRQQIHIKGSEIYNPTKSYYLPKNSLTIEAIRKGLSFARISITTAGDWQKTAIIYHPDVTGYLVSTNSNTSKPTHYSKVHFSDRGIHTVPTPKPKERGKNK